MLGYIYLQDLETMSQELVRLSKYPIQQIDSSASSNHSQHLPTSTDKSSTANGAVS